MENVKVNTVYLYSYEECMKVNEYYFKNLAYEHSANHKEYMQKLNNYCKEKDLSISIVYKMIRMVKLYSKEEYEKRQKAYLRNGYKQALIYKKYLAEQKESK